VLRLIKHGCMGIFIAAVVGTITVFILRIAKLPMIDPLLASMTLGIVIRSSVRFDKEFVCGLEIAPSLFIPICVIFLGTADLGYPRLASVEASFVFVLFIAFLSYLYCLSLLLFNLFYLKEKFGYFIAPDTVVCKASAMAIISKPKAQNWMKFQSA